MRFGTSNHILGRLISLSAALLTLVAAPAQNQAGGRAIGEFTSRQPLMAQENLTPPVELKPVEQEAWLSMAGAAGRNRQHG